jgi:hypothetical protein
VYRSAAAETSGRWLAWLVQAEFRGLQRSSSALREAVAPETVRRTRRRPHALARLPVPVTIRRPLIKPAAAVKPGTAVRQPRSVSPQPTAAAQRPPGTGDVAAAVPAFSPATPPPVKDQIDRSK